MIRAARSVKQRSGDVLVFKVWEALEDFGARGSAGKIFEDVHHADAHAPDAGPPTHLAGLDRDAGEKIALHDARVTRGVTPG